MQVKHPEQKSLLQTPVTTSGDYLQAVIDSLEDELLVIDRDFRIVQANKAVLERHGKHREEVIGQYCYEVSHGSPEICRSPGHECPLDQVWASGKPARATHLHIYEADNERKNRYLDIIASPIFDKKHKVIHVVELMRDVTEAKLLEMQIARLHDEVQGQDQIRGELLNQMFSIQEEERKRIARELHDETTQSLAGLAASLEALATTASDNALKTKLRTLQAVSLQSLDELRRLMYELRPAILDDFGLVAAIRSLANRELAQAGITIEFRTLGREKRLPVTLESTLYRVMQEAINNVARHSHASHCTITLQFKRSSVSVRVVDDGEGFDVKGALNTKDRPRGLGLLGMRERVGLMNGVLILSSEPGTGTEISIEIPLGEESKSEQDKNTHRR